MDASYQSAVHVFRALTVTWCSCERVRLASLHHNHSSIGTKQINYLFAAFTMLNDPYLYLADAAWTSSTWLAMEHA